MSNRSISNTSNSSVLGIVIGTTVVVGSLSSLGWYYYFTSAKGQGESSSSRHQSSRSSFYSDHSNLIKPPFPQTLRDMLSKCRLAYLSTVDEGVYSSHLSLMRFTYLHDENDGEIIIMSTNKNTKKYEMLSRQRGVALLVHDFDNAHIDGTTENNGNTKESTRSITLNGDCRILSGDDEDRYRKAHLAHNPDYPQFIVGEDIAVLCIDVTSARICDLNDRVVHWNVLDEQKSTTTD
mmetsp:Transcript_26805/g.62994  ORF Transcript_26805/g.62994 Transcript_26805/m.62994 type:complete len:236 (-) Transcript_26805:414-1121(-)|eukprot:CAMPEP_0197194678 /NCGR_PEP_ID=MMETSP1423-20130617/29680_1 /TAXON_ID=476441 /ORGANISM="Pseudo-nitzschia heimii, Strain UNC1101" /LENGTH=235 /DNA_ID=CAMNT_0042648139 /DNA_START=276 /DNA_END=983 /DNA_ORIENTATION=-